jgi:glutaminyl-peptide cyclotransferase
MPDEKNEVKNPDQEQFRKQRLFAQKLASWRDHRHLIVIVVVLLGAYVLFSLPWDEWNLMARLRHPSQDLKPGNPSSAKGALPFLIAGVSGQRALDEAKAFVAIGPRVSGTDGAKQAANHLADRLKKIGISPVIDEFKETGTTNPVFRNVIGMLDERSTEYIILASHYDTKSGIATNFVGANDSGSSCGLLLELARVMKEQPGPRPGILFAFLDGEECVKHYSDRDGLHGSRHMAAKLAAEGTPTNVLGVILLDMVGDRDLTITLPQNGNPQLASMVLRSATDEGVRLKFSLLDKELLDDHEPFLKAGIPAVDIIDFRYGSSSDRNDYWHTTEDTIDKLSAESLATVGRIAIRTVNKLIESAHKKNAGIKRP